MKGETEDRRVSPWRGRRTPRLRARLFATQEGDQGGTDLKHSESDSVLFPVREDPASGCAGPVGWTVRFMGRTGPV